MTTSAITIISNNRGPLTKSFSLKDGHLEKAAAADLVEGVATQVRVEDLTHFADILQCRGAHEALTYGVTRYSRIRIVTQKTAARGVHDAICRDRANFAWPQGLGIFMLDIDRPKDGSKPFKAPEFDALMCRLHPWWSGVGRMYRPSASAFICDEAGNKLIGAGSLRCYAIADKALNIPFLGVMFADAFWKAGFGRIEFSAAGSMLVRCPIDCAIWQPERLDFAGPVVLGPGLVKKNILPRIIEGGVIDTEAALAGFGKPSFNVWTRTSLEVLRAKREAKPEEKRLRKLYVEDRVREEVAAGVDEKRARQKWQAAFTTSTLSADFKLRFLNLGTLTVADVLKDPQRFDFERLADPADPTYADDPRIAQFYANKGKARPHIFSHAHGGCK
jgi:hypothetical protein